MPYIKLIRPYNCLFIMLTTFFGIFYLQSICFSTPVISALLSVFLISAAGYVINDFYDFKIDKINKPERVLPSGLIRLDHAKLFSFALFGAGIITAIFTLNIYCLAIAHINSISLYLYAKNFKKKLFIGNIIIAWNACSTFIYGALLTDNMPNVIPIIIFSFLFTIIREWVKLLEDYDGDKAEGVRSIAVLYGVEMGKKVVYLPAMLLISSVLIFSHYKYFTTDLFFLFTIIVSLPTLVFLIVLNRAKTQQGFHKIQAYMKLNMLCIMIVFIVNDVIKYRL